jgi:hypothetical protein
VGRLEVQVGELTSKVTHMDTEHEAEVTRQQAVIQQLSEELKGIDHTYSDRLN